MLVLLDVGRAAAAAAAAAVTTGIDVSGLQSWMAEVQQKYAANETAQVGQRRRQCLGSSRSCVGQQIWCGTADLVWDSRSCVGQQIWCGTADLVWDSRSCVGQQILCGLLLEQTALLPPLDQLQPLHQFTLVMAAHCCCCFCCWWWLLLLLQLQALVDRLLTAFKEATFDLAKLVSTKGLQEVSWQQWAALAARHSSASWMTASRCFLLQCNVCCGHHCLIGADNCSLRHQRVLKAAVFVLWWCIPLMLLLLLVVIFDD
jgi:hypothetical protein